MTPKHRVIPYGCYEHIDVPDDLEEDFEPDDCVLDEGRPSKCTIAFSLYKQGKNQTECKHWRPIKVMTKEKNT